MSCPNEVMQRSVLREAVDEGDCLTAGANRWLLTKGERISVAMPMRKRWQRSIAET
jgi:hypothetical protein